MSDASPGLEFFFSHESIASGLLVSPPELAKKVEDVFSSTHDAASYFARILFTIPHEEHGWTQLGLSSAVFIGHHELASRILFVVGANDEMAAAFVQSVENIRNERSTGNEWPFGTPDVCQMLFNESWGNEKHSAKSVALFGKILADFMSEDQFLEVVNFRVHHIDDLESKFERCDAVFGELFDIGIPQVAPEKMLLLFTEMHKGERQRQTILSLRQFVVECSVEPSIKRLQELEIRTQRIAEFNSVEARRLLLEGMHGAVVHGDEKTAAYANWRIDECLERIASPIYHSGPQMAIQDILQSIFDYRAVQGGTHIVDGVVLIDTKRLDSVVKTGQDFGVTLDKSSIKHRLASLAWKEQLDHDRALISESVGSKFPAGCAAIEVQQDSPYLHYGKDQLRAELVEYLGVQTKPISDLYDLEELRLSPFRSAVERVIVAIEEWVHSADAGPKIFPCPLEAESEKTLQLSVQKDEIGAILFSMTGVDGYVDISHFARVMGKYGELLHESMPSILVRLSPSASELAALQANQHLPETPWTQSESGLVHSRKTEMIVEPSQVTSFCAMALDVSREKAALSVDGKVVDTSQTLRVDSTVTEVRPVVDEADSLQEMIFHMPQGVVSFSRDRPDRVARLASALVAWADENRGIHLGAPGWKVLSGGYLTHSGPMDSVARNITMERSTAAPVQPSASPTSASPNPPTIGG